MAADAPLTWTVNGQTAVATLGDYRIEVNAAQPGQGVSWTNTANNAFQGHTLQFVAPASSKSTPQLVDLYVRGSDLIATYEQLPGAEVQPQLYWRLLTDDALQAVGVQVLISMQTSLLNSEPKCTVESQLPGARTAIWDFVSQAWNGSLPDQTFDLRLVPTASGRVTWFSVPKQVNSYIEVIYPDDYVAQHVTFGRSASCFFAEHLEKGVIRRGRIAGWLVPNKNLMSEAREPLKLLDFAKREALPLTT
ncbi:hypothetical protein ETAA8_31100 [Anatilimnocola aggregata]|uniref:Uncharacterized protein n=1 Tax=Anatilimnocola aggregata TaxID=2528021 RepID=A0A517YCR2_9BACT|nr:hypothetical protein [Anatilimnocola aggregata]QDU28018.1 hypothetical protein ETAA8_31100 [Anatilimnocola aggregata]